MSKRLNVISWDQYFMGIAVLSAKRSKDPNTQVGACIINNKKRILGIGYNGFPDGISDDSLPWDRTGEQMYDTKYPYCVHAEQNAIINSHTNLDGACIYVTLFPCSTCMKLIIQSGIKKIIYKDNLYKDTPEIIASTKLANMVGIPLIEYKTLVPNEEEIL